MTSSVLSLLFLISLFPSVSPTGLRVRVTPRALDVLKQVGVAFLEDLVDKPFEWDGKFSGVQCKLKIRLSQVSVKQDHVNLHLLDRRLEFQANELLMMGVFQHDVKTSICGSSGTTTTGITDLNLRMQVTLKQNKRHVLNVEMPECEVTGGKMLGVTNNQLGLLATTTLKTFEDVVKKQLCNLVRRFAVPKVNTMLKKHIMVSNMYQNQKLNMDFKIDYTLTDNIMLTPQHLELPFRARVFREGSTVNVNTIRQGNDPVIDADEAMAYVGISEFFFNSAAVALHESGPFQIHIPQITWIANLALKILGLPEGDAVVELSQPPIIAIHPDGLSVSVDAVIQSLKQPPPAPLPVICQGNMTVIIRETRLVLEPLDDAPFKCNVKPKTLKGKIVKQIGGVKTKLNNYMRDWFQTGVLIPLPDGVNFTQGHITYKDGFLVVSGDLSITGLGLYKLIKGENK